MKPLIIGQAPGPNTDPAVPLGGRCGDRLADLCGLELKDFFLLFERVNLIQKFPGKLTKGDAFPLDEARKGAIDVLIMSHVHERKIVLLGDNVAKAFGFNPSTLPTLQMHRRPAFPFAGVATCPHPSGVNRWWNEPDNVKRARRFWRRIAADALASELRSET